MDKIKLPIAIGIIVDDVGWHDGSDGRMQNMPARSGLPRFHHPDDVRALNAIGKGLNTKIVCSLVLAEWDRNNVLRGAEGIVPDHVNWDQASKIDLEYTQRYFEALEESEYLDYSLHGIFHAFYENGRLNTARQYYPNTYDENGNINGYRWHSPEKFEQMISLFFEIYNDWGFKKKITKFVSPCGCWGTPESEGNIAYAKILRKHGITSWNNSWAEFSEPVGFVDGIITAKGNNITAWNAYDVDPDYLVPLTEEDPDGVVSAHYCGHLTNFIRYNYQKNFEYVDKWVRYFKKYEKFGIEIARDVDSANSQMAYSRLARLSKEGDCYLIDLTAVDAVGAPGIQDSFLVSFAGDFKPELLTGGASIEEYSAGDGYRTYKITRGGNSIIRIKL